jgi:hypothetical protein
MKISLSKDGVDMTVNVGTDTYNLSYILETIFNEYAYMYKDKKGNYPYPIIKLNRNKIWDRIKDFLLEGTIVLSKRKTEVTRKNKDFIHWCIRNGSCWVQITMNSNTKGKFLWINK